MPTEQEVRLYARPDGVVPFTRWYRELRAESTARRIRERLARVRAGNFGDVRSVGDGVQELRIPVGPGIRIYLGRVDGSVVLLLVGGDKHSQTRDIRLAKLYWKEFRSRSNG